MRAAFHSHRYLARPRAGGENGSAGVDIAYPRTARIGLNRGNRRSFLNLNSSGKTGGAEGAHQSRGIVDGVVAEKDSGGGVSAGERHESAELVASERARSGARGGIEFHRTRTPELKRKTTVGFDLADE